MDSLTATNRATLFCLGPKVRTKKGLLKRCLIGAVNLKLLLFSPLGVNTGGVGSYIYDDPEAEAQDWTQTPRQDARCLSDLPSKVTHRDGYLDLYVVFVYRLYIYFLYLKT